MKPQTFASDHRQLDPTNGVHQCDFCNWKRRTAEDAFGRIELPHAVTGSNLFKYCAPSHGVVMFKHHDPLSFDVVQLKDLFRCSWLWFRKSHDLHPSALFPFFIWNCLPRAGASQYHGHAQVMLSEVPFPAQARLANVLSRYDNPGTSYHQDLLRLHSDVGLLRSYVAGKERAWCYASLVPLKDMELVVVGTHMTSWAFIEMLHTALRTVIDRMGCKTFNVGILNIQLSNDAESGGVHTSGGLTIETTPGQVPPHVVVARMVSRGKIDSRASDFGGLEVFGSASIGHTDPYDVMSAFDDELRFRNNVIKS